MSKKCIEKAMQLGEQFFLLADGIEQAICKMEETDDIRKDEKLMRSYKTMYSIYQNAYGLSDSLQEGKEAKNGLTITAYKNQMDAYYVKFNQSIEQIYQILQSKQLHYYESAPLPGEAAKKNLQSAYQEFQKSFAVYANERKEEAAQLFDNFMNHNTYDETELNTYANNLKTNEIEIKESEKGYTILDVAVTTFPQALALIHTFRSKKWNSTEYNNLEKSMLNLMNHSKQKDYNMNDLIKDINNVSDCIKRYKEHTMNGAGEVSFLSNQTTRDKKVAAVNKVEELLGSIYYIDKVSDELGEYIANKGDLSDIGKKEEPARVSREGAVLTGKKQEKTSGNTLQGKDVRKTFLP